MVDTVVMNPPFGTRKKGSDMEFLAKALKVRIVTISHPCHGYHHLFVNFFSDCSQVASQAVYSLHKTTTRDVSCFYLHVVRKSIKLN